MIPKLENSDPFQVQAEAPKRGRRTIEDGWLSANRDSLIELLCAWWPDIGWQLITAGTREDIRQALQPAKDHSSQKLIDRLLRPTSVTEASATEIRKQRSTLGRGVRRRYDARTKLDECVKNCHEIEAAIGQARPDQIDFVLREFIKRGTSFQAAHAEYASAEAEERILERDLLDQEAAFAQDELLSFITESEYAMNPFNLANAMAGLPFGIDVPFIGAWQSHARCSQLETSHWPNSRYQRFEKIESMWEHSKHSPTSWKEVFQKEIRALPKKLKMRLPGDTKPRYVDNYVRRYLCENWWFLKRAIERSLQTNSDTRPMHFIIASTFDKVIGESRTHADSAMAKAESICE